MSGPFQPGDVVQCIAIPPLFRFHPPRDALIKRALYRVSSTVRGNDGEDPLAYGVLLEGMSPKPYVGYHAGCFRKVDEEVTPAFREQMRNLSNPRRAPMLNPARHSRERV